MIIGRVEVEDPDEGDNGRLELRVAPPNNRLFSVSSDGVISVNGDFTANHFGEHRVIIVARDHGEPPRETRGEVIVNIFGTLITMATMAPTNEIFEYTSSVEEETPTQPDYVLQSVTTAPTSFETNGKRKKKADKKSLTAFSSFPSPKPLEPSPTAGQQPNTVGQTTVSESNRRPGEQAQGTDYYSTETSEEVTEPTTTTPTTTTTTPAPTTTTTQPPTQVTARL